jgi:hypothetical protein
MVFNVPKIIYHLSRVMTLEPCDIIATGTPSGARRNTVEAVPPFLRASSRRNCFHRASASGVTRGTSSRRIASDLTDCSPGALEYADLQIGDVICGEFLAGLSVDEGDPACAKVCPKHAIMYTRRDVGPRVLARYASRSLAESLLEAWRSRIQK